MSKKDKKTKVKSPFNTGRVDLKAKGGSFLSVKEGESIKIVPLVSLDELVSADMHQYWDVRPAIYHPCLQTPDCPGCIVGNEARFKAYMPVQLQDGTTAIYPFTASIYKQLDELEEGLERSIKGLALKISREGSGKKTRYSVLNLGKEVDVSGTEVPDVIPAIGSIDRDEIIAKLKEVGIPFEDGGYAELSKEDGEDGW